MTDDIYFTGEHRAFRDSVRRFVRAEMTPYVDEWEAAKGFPRELYRKCGALGLLGLGHVEEFGGSPSADIFHLLILTPDPNDHRNLLVYSQLDQQVFRTINADAGSPSWCAITSSTPFPNNTLPTIPAMAVAPSSGVIFGATTGQIVRAPNACACNSCTWEAKGAAALAGTSLSSVTIDTSQTCNATACTLFVTNVGLDSDPNAPIRVFRSTDSGTNWENVSGRSGQCSSGACPNGLPCVNGGCAYALPPNVAANSLVIHPGNRTTLYAGTDMGIYQGCLSCRSLDGTTCNSNGSMVICNQNGTVWTWSKFMTGFPKTAQVSRLAVHADSGVMRAFTYGRSAWEIPSANYVLPNPELKVNTTNPTTDVAHDSARVSSGNTGQEYAVGWADDRRWCSGSLQGCTQNSDCPTGQTCNGGASKWHIFFRGYNYDANGHPTPISSDLRVDTTNNTHVAQAPAISGHPTADNVLPYCARLAWHDDRIAASLNQHVYTQYFCTDGYKLFNSDLKVDQNAPCLNAPCVNATNAAMAFQQSLDFAVAWQNDRTAGSALHDVYARFFGVFGLPKGSQFPVNTSTLDATSPAIAGDANSNVFIAWEEFDSATLNGKIMISKYNSSGSLVAGPVPVDNNGVGATGRHEVNLAVDTAGNILTTWWEGKSDGSQPEAVFRRRFTNTLAPVNGEDETQVNTPPQLPVAKRALRGSVAADVSGNFAISWWANVNDQTDLTGNIFGKGYNPSASILKNDFRVDLAPRTGLPLHPRIARSPFTSCYTVVWRDNRAGHYDVYTRTVTTQ